MNKKELINRLPPHGFTDKTIKDALEFYGSWIMYDSESKGILSDREMNELDSIIKEILLAYRYTLTGQISKCYETIYKIIFSKSYIHQIYNTSKIEQDNFFYRMRQCDNEYLFSKEELFHIPFQERQKISNQRYSLTGYPCLYLGKSVYVCWEELNRPKFDNSNIVGLKNIRPINLLDFRLPTEINTVSDLYRIPLIIASSVNVQQTDLPFKPEYIISQSILHALIVHNNTSPSPNNLNGIIYYSSKINSPQSLFDDINLFENIVVPTVNNTIDPNAEQIYQDGYCPVLCNTFEITNPISFNTYRLSKDSKTSYIFGEDIKGENRSYNRTEMALMEEKIKRLETHKILPNNFFRSRPELLQKY